ncbi:hypothetical protein [Streptomyces sp. NPDC003832]
MTGVVLSGLALGTVMSDETGSPLLTAAALVGGPLVQLVLARHLPATSDLTAAAHRGDRHGDDLDEYGDPPPAARADPADAVPDPRGRPCAGGRGLRRSSGRCRGSSRRADVEEPEGFRVRRY